MSGILICLNNLIMSYIYRHNNYAFNLMSINLLFLTWIEYDQPIGCPRGGLVRNEWHN